MRQSIGGPPVKEDHLPLRFVVAFWLLAGVCPFSPAGPRVDLIGHWGGTIQSLAIRGRFAYAGIGPRLVILDISDPHQPLRVGQTEPVGHIVFDIALDGPYAYLAAYEGGMRIVDVSNPAEPRVISSVGSPPRPPPYDVPDRALAIAKTGSSAFVFYYDAGLRVFDVSDPANPLEIGEYQVTGPLPYGLDMAIRNNIAHLLTWTRMTLVDLSTPSTPAYLSELYLQNWTNAIEVDDRYAYLAENALGIVDISDPHAPTFVTRIADKPTTCGWLMALSPNRVYLHDDSTGMAVIDISDPTRPIWRGSIAMDSTLGGAVAADGSLACLGDWYSGISFVDASDADHPVKMGRYDDVAQCMLLTPASDNLLLSCGYRPGVQVIDIADPTAPRRVAEWGADRTMHAELRGTTAYLGSRRFSIMDVTTLASPTLLGEIDLLDSITGAFAVAGDHAYVGTYDGGLRVIDITSSSAPRLIATVNNGPANGVAVCGNLAYVATYDHGLQIFDISHPSAPLLLGGTAETGALYCVILVDDVAYVGGNQGVHVVDISNVHSPQVIPITLPGYWGQVRQLCVHNNYLLVPLEPGVRVLDATDPRAPRYVGAYTAQGWCQGVASANGQAFLGNSEGGIEVVAVHPLGDLNGDDRVGLEDLVTLLLAYGSCVGDQQFNRYADLNNDGCIALEDLADLLTQYEA